MTLRLADLKKKCENLGYSIHSRGLRASKAEFLAVLRQHFINQDYPDGLPYTEIAPMLCAEYHRLLPKAQEQVWRDDNGWVAQEKFNGERAILHFVRDVGTFVHSRVISTKNFRRTEWSRQSPLKGYIPAFGAVVDCEATNNGALFHVFDVLNWEGADLKSKGLDERLAYCNDVRAAVKDAGMREYFDFPSVCFTGKRQFYDSIIQRGGEGVVLKRLDSQYTLRREPYWLKVKRKVEFDAFVVGFKQGKASSRYRDQIAYLIFAVQTESGQRVIAKIASLPSSFRRDVSLYNPKTGKVELRLDVLNKVATVAGMELSRKAMRLAHPKIIRWRGDLRPENCLYKEADVLATAAGSTSNLPLRLV